MKKILIVVGTRPNFIKVTRFKKLAAAYNVDVKIVHTGQHYDDKMADIFFQQFKLQPDFFLNIPVASANTQIAEIMLRLERFIEDVFKPDLMIVPGDVSSTLAAALTANKLGIKIAHLESGLRSFDRTMPEEINRLLTDQLSDLFFVTEQSGLDHLQKEGFEPQKIHFVGNTMIDTLVEFADEIDRSPVMDTYNLQTKQFVLMTMHRPATVDFKEGLVKLISIIEHITKSYKLIFPLHPRTLKKMEDFGLSERFNSNKNIVVTSPLDYFAFQKLIKESKFILTDSGGIQEESTFRQIPCITLRPNTERPVTCTVGTNTLMPFDEIEIQKLIEAIETDTYKKGSVPSLWDGKTTERILEIITNVNF